jgi:ribosomal protein L10
MPAGMDLRARNKEEAIKELHNFHSSFNIIMITESSGMRVAKHVAYRAENRNADKVLVGKSEERRPLGDLGVGGGLIVK